LPEDEFPAGERAMKKTMLLAATLALAACAGTSTKDGLVYRDGSWYSPAAGGHGDYYTGRERHYYGGYYYPWAWDVGFASYGGYCPIEYRYCTSFWADPWFGAMVYPGYYRPFVFAYAPQRMRRHDPMVSLFDEGQDGTGVGGGDPGARGGSSDPGGPMRPRDRAPGIWGPRHGAESAPVRPRRRPPAAGGTRD